MPIAGIKLRKRSSSSGGGGGEKASATGRNGASEGCKDLGPSEGLLRQSASTAKVGAGDGLIEDGKKKRQSSKKKSKRPRTEGTNPGDMTDIAGNGGYSATDGAPTVSPKTTDGARDVKREASAGAGTASGGTTTAALGLVSYSSGEDDDPDGEQ